MKKSRRDFIKTSAKASAAAYIGSLAFSPASYARILGANDRVRVGIVGYSDRFRSSLLPTFLHHNKELNFDMVAVSDIWRLRREHAAASLKEKVGHEIKTFSNNEALYSSKEVDAVIISTADFQHALHAIEAVRAG